MLPTQQGSIRLFRFAGIHVYLHWSWFLVALIEVQTRSKEYSSLVWNALEYVTLFGIVLLHEFGHALACRQVGGQAERIVLWPLGGVAYVAPPPRPGPVLWSIAAGPLVNLVLTPVFVVLYLAADLGSMAQTNPDLHQFLRAVCAINLGLLVFNLLPIYPLDGGQIMHAVLWFIVGRAQSLMITTLFGFVGVAGLIALAVFIQSFWAGLVAVFMLMSCWRGLMHAQTLARADKLPRRGEFACPACRLSPPAGPFWRCGQCLKAFDTFETQGTCLHCGAEFPTTQCLDCGRSHALTQWLHQAQECRMMMD